MFCILYGLCGIPLCLVWISELGSFFGDRAKRLSQVLIRKGVSVVRNSHVHVQLTLSRCGVNKDVVCFLFSSPPSEKGAVNLHGLVPIMGAAGAPGDPAVYFHVYGGMDLLRRPLLLFHHSHNGRLWRLRGRWVEFMVPRCSFLSKTCVPHVVTLK